MEETLISLILAILAVGVAVFLRFRRIIREAEALHKRVVALEQRTIQLERAQWQAELAEVRARNVRSREESSAHSKPGATAPTSPAHRPELAAHSLLLTESQKVVAEVLNQLYVMNAQVSRERIVEEKYIAEFESIVDRLERATGCDLSRWLGIPPQERQPAGVSPGEMTRVSKVGLQSRDSTLFRLSILSLQAFCNYQASQLPEGFVPPPPEAAGLIH